MRGRGRAVGRMQSGRGVADVVDWEWGRGSAVGRMRSGRGGADEGLTQCVAVEEGGIGLRRGSGGCRHEVAFSMRFGRVQEQRGTGALLPCSWAVRTGDLASWLTGLGAHHATL